MVIEETIHLENRGEFMTLDEAIIHAREVASEQKIRSGACVQNDSECDKFSTCLKCAEEHDQLAEWLEELKFLKQWKSDIMDSFCKYDVSSFEELVANARNKAIDDFVKEICKMYVQSERNGNYRFYAVEIKQAIADLAKQLKAGIIND